MRFLEKTTFTAHLSTTIPASTKYLAGWLFDVSTHRKLAVWIKAVLQGTPSTGAITVKLLDDIERVQSITFSETFNGDGVTTTFQLSHTWVVWYSETVTVDGTTQTRGTDYSINYETGQITFSTAPADGAQISVVYSYIPFENCDDLNNPLLEFASSSDFRKTLILDVEPLQAVRLFIENSSDVDIDILVKSAKVSL